MTCSTAKQTAAIIPIIVWIICASIFSPLHREYYEREAHRDEYRAHERLGHVEQAADGVSVDHVAQRVCQLPPRDYEHYVAYHDFVRQVAYSGLHEQHDGERRRGAA